MRNKMTAFCLIFICGIFATTPANANDVDELPDALKSSLDQSIQLEGFGTIRYRGPLEGATGPVITLFHGIYGGSTHRAYRELLPALDQAGARVYIMDLPGIGESEKPKREYSIEVFDHFVKSFLQNVVGQPSVLVGESILTASVLRTAAELPALCTGVVLLSPTGVNTLAQGPTDTQNLIFNSVWKNKLAGLGFYKLVLSKPSVRYFLEKSYYDDSLVTDLLVQESRIAKQVKDQRWLTFAFVGGRIWRTFVESQMGVNVPVLAIFGAEAESITSGSAQIESADNFAAIRPDFDYVTLPATGLSVQRESTQAVLDLILNKFSSASH